MPRRAPGARTGNSGEPSPFGVKTALRKIFNLNFSIVITVNLIVMAIYFLVIVTGAQHVLSQYGTSLSVAGLSSGIMVIGCLVGRFLGGYLFSILGGKKLLFFGLFTFFISFALALLLTNLPGVFLARFVTGFGEGVSVTATGTIAAWVIPRECKGFGISIFSLSVVLGLALGPFFGILLINRIPYQSLMLCLLAMSFVLWLSALLLKDIVLARKIHRKATDLYAYMDPRVIPFSIVICLIFMSYGCIQIFLASYAAERGLTETASFFFLFYGIAAIASRPFTGRKFDKSGENVILYPLFAITIAGLLILAAAHSSLSLLLAGFLCGVGYGNFQSIGQAVAVCLVTPTRYAQATSTFFTFMDFGIGIGPYLFGFVVAAYGYGAMFIFLAVILFMSLILYYLLHGRKMAKL